MRIIEIKSIKQKIEWVKPEFETEVGEFERVGNEFGISIKLLREVFDEAQIVKLDNDVFFELENTDANDDTVTRDLDAAKSYLSANYGRDADAVEDILKSGRVECPIILKFVDQLSNTRYHLVSGNTRLTVAEALNIIPYVIIVDVDTNVRHHRFLMDKNQIRFWIEKYTHTPLSNCIIEDDFTVTLRPGNNLTIHGVNSGKILVKFNNIENNLYVTECGLLTSLEGLPATVGGRVLLRDVYGLKNLHGIPRSTRREQVEIRHCDITTLEGLPSDLDDLVVTMSRLQSLKGLPVDTMTSLAIDSVYLEAIDYCPREITDWAEFAVSYPEFKKVSTLPREIGNQTLRISVTNSNARPNAQLGEDDYTDGICDDIAKLNRSYTTRVTLNGKKYAVIKGKDVS